MPHLKLFGEASVDQGDGAAGSLTSRRHPMALLCLLALSPSRKLPRGKAVGFLWPESAEATARNRLTTCVYQVRKALGEGAVVSAGDELCLNLDVLFCDVHEFEEALAQARYARAVEIYGGALLDGFGLRGSPEFEHWLELQRDRLRRGYHEALEALASRAEDEGDLDRAARWWRERMASAPFDTRAARRLMGALAGAGNRGEALRVAQQHAQILEEEFGAEPDDEFRALVEKLETAPARELPQRASGVESAAPAPAGVALGTGHRGPGPLIGREAELSRLEALLEAAEAGEPGLVLLGGDAGIGKSRLTGALADAARRRGQWVLRGECVQLADSALPFAPLIEALRGLARQVEPARLSELLGPARGELGRFVPGLADGAVGGTPGAKEIDGARQRGRVATAAAEALERMSHDRGVLVVVEDIHWADEATLDLLRYLTRALADQRVLVVATFRTDEVPHRHPLVSVLGELLRSRIVTRLDLEPLDRDGVAILLAERLGERPEPHLVDEVKARSGGNAFYVEQLAAAAKEDEGARGLPPALREVVAARLERLPKASHELLAPIAVAGNLATYRLLAAVTGLEDNALADALRPAIERRLLVATEDGCDFQHALVREVVLAELLVPSRAGHHRRIAEVLEAEPELATSGRAELRAELAHHWHAAKKLGRALEASLAAAADAEDVGAFSAALAHYERALSVWPQGRGERGEDDRLELVASAARAAELASAHARAAAHLRELLAAPSATDPEQEATLRDRLADVLFRAARHQQAREESARSVTTLDGRPDSSAKAAALTSYARVLRQPGIDRIEEATAVAREALGIARRVGDRRAESLALRELGTASSRSGKLDESIAHHEQALAVAKEIGDPHATISTYYWLAMAVLHVDQVRGTERATELAEEILAFLDAGGDRWPRSASLRWLPARAFLRSGDWRRAEEALERMARQHLEGHGLSVLHIARAALYWMRGELADAEAELLARRRALPNDVSWNFNTLQLGAQIAAEKGLTDEVRARRRELMDLGVTRDDASPILEGLLPCVRAAVDLALEASVGERIEALEVADEMLSRMRELAARLPSTRPETARVAAQLTAAEAELSRANAPDRALWRRVEREALHHVWPAYTRVYARWRRAEALLATGEREVAGDVLAAAHAEACRLGAARLRGHVERLAQRARIQLPGPDGNAISSP